MSNKETDWGWDQEVDWDLDKILTAGTNPPGLTPDGLLSGLVFADDNGVFVHHVGVVERMRMNARRSPEDQVAPVQPGFERQEYPIYLELLADKAAGKWDPSKG